MTFIKIGRHIINTQYISHVDTKVTDGSNSYVAIYMINFKGNVFSGGIKAEEYSKKDPSKNEPLSADVIYLFKKDAEDFKAYFSQPSVVTVIN